MSGREQDHRLAFYPQRHLLRLLLAALCVVTGIAAGLVWCGISDVEQASSVIWAYLGGAAVFLLVDVAVFMWFICEWKLRDLAVIVDVDGVAICCGSYEEHLPASAVSGACVCCGVCNTSTNFELGSLLLTAADYGVYLVLQSEQTNGSLLDLLQSKDAENLCWNMQLLRMRKDAAMPMLTAYPIICVYASFWKRACVRRADALCALLGCAPAEIEP